MKQRISMFPVLSREIIQETKLELLDKKFSYSDGFHNHELESESILSFYENSESIKLVDKLGCWDIGLFGLTYEFCIRFSSSKFFFGKNGIANRDTVIGIGVQILSKSSEQREFIVLDQILSGQTDHIKRYRVDLQKGKYRNNGTIKFVLFTKEPDPKKTDSIDEVRGRIIGYFGDSYISFTGDGSLFPVAEVDEKEKPLWSVYKNWISIDDEFEKERFCIEINKAHPSYKLLTNGKNVILTNFTKEIIASALTCFMLEVKDSSDQDIERMVNGSELVEGSIGYVVHYFIKTHGWKLSSPIEIGNSIREFFDKEVTTYENS